MPVTLWTNAMNDLDKKFYKISEVAEILHIPASTLRFWEKQFTIFRPRRNSAGTRFYTPQDIEKIRMIYYLVKEKGLKIEAAQDQLRNNSSGLSRLYEVVARLRSVRSRLNAILTSLNSFKG